MALNPKSAPTAAAETDSPAAILPGGNQPGTQFQGLVLVLGRLPIPIEFQCQSDLNIIGIITLRRLRTVLMPGRRDEMVATAIFRWRQRRCAALRGPRGWWRCVGCPPGCLRRHAGRGLLRVACGVAVRLVASRLAAGSHLVPAGCCLRLAGDARPPAARHARTPRLRGAIGCRWLLVGGDGSRGVRRGARCGVGERRVEVVRVEALGAIFFFFFFNSSSTRWIVQYDGGTCTCTQRKGEGTRVCFVQATEM